MHAGNTRYKALVESYRDEYELANKVEKTKIAKEIILRVKSGNGRFLKQATKGSDPDGSKRPVKRKNRCSNATIGWVEVTDVQVRDLTDSFLTHPIGCCPHFFAFCSTLCLFYALPCAGEGEDCPCVSKLESPRTQGTFHGTQQHSWACIGGQSRCSVWQQ